MCSSLKFESEESHLNLLYFCVLYLPFLGIQPPFIHNFEFFGSEPHLVQSHLHLQLSWLCTKGGSLLKKFKITKQLTQNYNKIRWLASDLNFKLLHTGCPNAYAVIMGLKRKIIPFVLSTDQFFYTG